MNYKFGHAAATAMIAVLASPAFSAAPPHRTRMAGKQNVKAAQPQTVANAYIVEFSGDSAATSLAKANGARFTYVADREAMLAQHRARVAREHVAMRSALEGRGAQIHSSVDIVMNAMTVKYAGSRQDLESIPGVKHVYPVRRMKKSLDRAVGLTQVSDVWSRIGGTANAGIGMKIGIIDTGIDLVHPGFKDTGFQAPAGFPKSDSTADAGYTNNKVIVARSYANMASIEVFGQADPDPTVQDHSGHGTALAMVAAGVTNAGGPYGTITGVAPGAYLGIYRIWTTLQDQNGNDQTTDAADLAAINDAVADGMDVINLSFGSIYASRFDQDPLVQAVEAAYQAGTLVVCSAGNDGPYFSTLASPASAPHAIAVGASSNDRAFGPAVWAPYVGTFGGWNASSLGENTTACYFQGFCSWVYDSGDGAAPSNPLTAPLVDAAALNNALGCSAFSSSLSGSIVMIARGTCNFSVKAQNAQNAGAVGVLISDTQADTDGTNGNSYAPYGPSALMSGLANLIPTQMIDYYSAQYISSQLAVAPFNLTMGFNTCGDANYSTPCAFGVTPNLLVGFSSAGPGIDLGIKPEVVAPGENMSMATQSYDTNGDMFDSTGYIVADGTSFASPFTAGVAALIKSARPGLTIDQYRSLIINSAKTMTDPNNYRLSVAQVGGGVINALAAYQSQLVASPSTLALGTASASPQLSQTVTLTNIGNAADTFTLSSASLDGTVKPAFDSRTVTIAAGQSQTVNIQFNGSNLAAGAYEGSVIATSANTGGQFTIPYWLDVPGNGVYDYLVLGGQAGSYSGPSIEAGYETGLRNQAIVDAFDFRLVDAGGVPITNITPTVTVVSGGGKVTAVNSADGANANVSIDSAGDYLQDIPGLWTVDVVLGSTSGNNVFQVTAGSLSFQITITGCRSYNLYGQCLL